jgi:hypothetical protein
MLRLLPQSIPPSRCIDYLTLLPSQRCIDITYAIQRKLGNPRIKPLFDLTTTRQRNSSTPTRPHHYQHVVLQTTITRHLGTQPGPSPKRSVPKPIPCPVLHRAATSKYISAVGARSVERGTELMQVPGPGAAIPQLSCG